MTDEPTNVSYNPYQAPTAALNRPVTAGGEPSYFTVGGLKLVAMSLATLGLYLVYWSYRNWKLIAQRDPSSIMPFWRALFSPIWTFALGAAIEEDGRAEGVAMTPSAVVNGLFYFGLSVSSAVLPDPWPLVSLIAFAPFLAIQSTAHGVLVARGEPTDRYSRFTGWNVVGLVVGGLFLMLTIIGFFLPEV